MKPLIPVALACVLCACHSVESVINRPAKVAVTTTLTPAEAIERIQAEWNKRSVPPSSRQQLGTTIHLIMPDVMGAGPESVVVAVPDPKGARVSLHKKPGITTGWEIKAITNLPQ